jgi:hypothetical protein
MPRRNHKGGSGYVKQFESLLAQSGGNSNSIPTCTNTTTAPHHPGQQPGLVIDNNNPLLTYQMSTPFDGNKFGSALDTVQNTSTCKYAGPGALEQIAVGGARKKTIKKRTSKKKVVKRTPKKKSTTKKKVVKKTPKKKSAKRKMKK